MQIAITAALLHPTPERDLFRGKTLVYIEEGMSRWLMSAGVEPKILPRPWGSVGAERLLSGCAGLIFSGGADVSPLRYGEEPLKPEWSGDVQRDSYEFELFTVCLRQKIPILGICRGVQLLNVACGGTLYQDVPSMIGEAVKHRCGIEYDRVEHHVDFAEGSALRRLYPGISGGLVNSVHHQAVKELGKGLTVEAVSREDGLVEAVRSTRGDHYLAGYQWHPEFQPIGDKRLLATEPILNDFLAACRSYAAGRGSK
jgi:putative glutamine amidotransferase